MANNMECEICGGTDFYKESGYFFCNECQTQSQEVREHEFEEEVVNVKGKRKIRTEKSEKLDNRITSWECYNIVLHSLTEQLIHLGAGDNLKPVAKCLWMKYLEKLEVLDLKKDVKPKLQLLNFKRDADILYGRKTKKRKRRKSSDESCVSRGSSSQRREMSKKKRALVQAHYEEYSQKSTQESGSSLHNETLSSLQSPSEKSEQSEEPLNFNQFGIEELENRTSRGRKPDEQDHNLSKSHVKCSTEYLKGVHFLSPKKIYSILYLALLINRDQIQLGDLFRYIREGHLAFNNYTKLFPEEYMNKFLNIQNNSKNNLFTNKLFREMAAKMAVFLDITNYIKVVDLTSLCQRYCREMNLPDEIYRAVRNIISRTNPKLEFNHRSKTIPNYEARAMSIILFILKLLFGLDDVTEWKLSKYAQCVNNTNSCNVKMFDIVKWLEYIGYRCLLIREHHFPSQHLYNTEEVDSDLFLQSVKSQGIKLDENVKLTKEMIGYKELLTNINKFEDDGCTYTKFEPSLTPFLNYSQMLSSPKNCLKLSFLDNSLDFLLRPNKYLCLVSNDVQLLKHGGANDNWIIEGLKTYKKVKSKTWDNSKLVQVEISQSDTEENIDGLIHSSAETSNKKLDPRYVRKAYRRSHKRTFSENKIYVDRISEEVQLEDDNVEKSDDYNVHYNPYERYWLYLQMNLSNFSKDDIDTHVKKYTGTFKLVFSECARIIEQTNEELLQEFQFSEIFLVYCASYCDENKKRNKDKELLNADIQCYFDQAKNYW